MKMKSIITQDLDVTMNNKQGMKLYTEEQVRQMIEKSRDTGLTAEFLILTTTPVELPSDSLCINCDGSKSTHNICMDCIIKIGKENIQLPSDEEIEEKLNVAYGNGYEQGEMDFYKKMKSQGKLYADGYEGGYKRALDYMTDTIKNKIEVMENANNEFKKGTANTTHTTFLCTEFVSDASKGATLPRCIRCGKTQRIHPIITKNNEQQ